MEIKTNLIKTLGIIGSGLLIPNVVVAENIKTNMAQLQALDKVTGKMSVIEVPVNGEARFGSFSVIVRDCQTTPPEETPENYAFVDVADTNKDGKIFNIFKGWMVSSSPSLNSVEHPIYDVWLLKCINADINAKTLLSEDKLAERDKLEKYTEQSLSKEAQKAKEIKEEQEKILQQKLLDEQQREIEKQEEQARQEEIQKELAPVEDNSAKIESVEINDGEDSGPVSLFNIGMQDPISEQDTSAEALVNTDVEEITQEHNIENTQAIDGLVIIDADSQNNNNGNVPTDINEVLPASIEE